MNILLLLLIQGFNLTVGDCIRKGMEENEKLREMRTVLDRTKTPGSRFIPHLSLSGGYNLRSRRDLLPFPDTIVTSQGKWAVTSPEDIPVGALSYSIGRIEISLPVWDINFEARRNLMLAEAELNRADYKREVFTLRYSIRGSYWQIKLEEKMLQIKEKWLKELSEELAKVKSRHQAGRVLKPEVLRLEVERAKAEVEEREIRDNFRFYQEELKDLLKIPEEESMSLAETFSLDSINLNIDSLKNRAFFLHPDILKAEAVLNRARNNLRHIKTSNRFNISLIGDLSNRSDILGFEGTFYRVGIEGRLYLLDGGWRRAKISDAAYELADARYRLYKLKKEIASDIESRYYQATNLYHLIQAQLRELEYVEENLKVVKLRYEQGLSSLDDVIQILKRREDAWEDYYKNLFNYNKLIGFFKEIMELGEYGDF